MNSIPYNKINEDLKINIIEEYYKGSSFEDICTEFNISKRALPRILKENNINSKLKNRYTLNETYFEKIDTEENAYWLGYLYADGYIGNDKINNIVLTSVDIEHMSLFAKAIDLSMKPRLNENAGGFIGSKPQAVVNFSNKKMCEDLRSYGLFTKKSLEIETLPDINSSLLNHFIRGYFDGDGSIFHVTKRQEKNGKEYKYIYPCACFIGTEKFLNEISKSINLNHRLRHSKTKEMKYIEYNTLDSIFSLYDYLYNNSNIYLERKHNKFIELLSPFKK